MFSGELLDGVLRLLLERQSGLTLTGVLHHRCLHLFSGTKHTFHIRAARGSRAKSRAHVRTHTRTHTHTHAHADRQTEIHTPILSLTTHSCLSTKMHTWDYFQGENKSVKHITRPYKPRTVQRRATVHTVTNSPSTPCPLSRRNRHAVKSLRFLMCVLN